MALFYGLSSTASRLEPHQGDSLLLPLSFQKFLVLILLTSEGRKAQPTLETRCDFKYETPGSGIQQLNH